MSQKELSRDYSFCKAPSPKVVNLLPSQGFGFTLYKADVLKVHQDK